jgi:putative tryptophan/tyrosine transport system substrate-binding protein
MTVTIGRRELLAALGGAAAAWPLVAQAQQDRRRLVGVVAGFSEPEMRPQLTALRSKLSELGWIEGHNLELDARLGAGDFQRMTVEAGSLLGRNPDVIVTMGTPGLNAVRHHTKSIPVVFTLVADPARLGLIESLARPGGHATGFTNFELSIGQKWLELIREVSPKLARVTIVNNPANPTASQMSRPVEDAGRTMSIQVSTAFVRSASEIESAIQSAAQQPDSGIIVIPDSFAVVHSDLILRLVERHRLPAIYPFRLFALKGGLLTYGLDIPEIYRQAAEYVDRILRGAKPSDLPVQAPNKFELIINLKTAKALGIDVPPTLLARADEVIE